ncbi:MAG: adenosylcobalamin-dependent ribonucleoside-diphosphate reductase [Actinobacteria bacterium]|nr:adenosylcobalamin-dependent ribonucleoside-diphosphate reductase [Actinomycetota bacterium]
MSENALAVLRKRYFLKDRVDHPTEDVDAFFQRVVGGVVKVERERGWVDGDAYRQICDDAYGLLRGLRFVPNSPCLMNSGKPEGYAQMAACFVLPIEDNLRSIKTTDMNAALIHQSGGGTGFNFSTIRPRGDFVRSSGGVASGPVSFMSMIDHSCGEIKQGGTRRGANMGILNVDHPDILNFIACKAQDGKIANFNISVGVTDAFMRAVEADEPYDLVNPRTGAVYSDPATGEARRMRARDVWDKLIEGAWLNGEPGVIFLDRIRATNPTPAVGAQDTTNPCGEQPLLPYEACVLGSLNLNAHLDTDRSAIDWQALRRDVHLAIRFLDDMVEASNFPLPEIDAIVKRGNRRVGLGVMGWADILFALGVRYDSPQAEALARRVMRFINDEARRASEALAEIRGPFPNWEGSRWSSEGHRPRRNATVTTIAPTGTISMIADCSSGIEPLFALIFWKNVMRDGDDGKATSLRYLNPVFERFARAQGLCRDALIDAIEANHGSLCPNDTTPAAARAVLEGVPAAAREVFVTAHDIPPDGHIRTQAAFQEHCENAVSKTINFTHAATRADVARGYWQAYRTGCKGVTVYRDGSRVLQVLTTSATPESAVAAAEAVERSNGHAPATPPSNGNGHARTASNGKDADFAITAKPRLLPEGEARESVSGSHPLPEGDEPPVAGRRGRVMEGHAAPTPMDERLPVVAAITRERPDEMHGATARIRTGCGPLFVTINDDARTQPFEVFATLGKAGGCAAAQTEAIGRMVSLALRSGVALEEVHKHLRGITCHRPAGIGPARVLSCADGIAQVIARRLHTQSDGFVPLVDLQGQGTYTPLEAPLPPPAVPVLLSAGQTAVGGPVYQEMQASSSTFVGACPNCGGNQLFHAEGCVKCVSCGYSDCG